MTGPLWDSGHGVHWSSTVLPAATVMEVPALVAPTWQMISGSWNLAGSMKPLSKSSGIDQPATTGGGLENWKDGL